MGQCLEYYPDEYVEEGALIGEPAIRIPMDAYWRLKEWMLENDPDRILRTDREEDLKIIHRLLDVLDKGTTPMISLEEFRKVTNVMRKGGMSSD